MRPKLLLVCQAMMLVALSGCNLFWYGQQTVTLLAEPLKGVKLAQDTSAIRDLVKGEIRSQSAISVHGAAEMKFRNAFLEEFKSKETFWVAGRTHAMLLERTRCLCGSELHVTNAIIRIKVSDGPSKGTIGWLCDTEISYDRPVL